MHTYGGDPSLPPRLGSCSQQEHLERAGPGRAGFGSCHGWITPRQGRVEDFLLHLSSIFPHTTLVPLTKDVLEQPGCSEWLCWERRGLTRERLCRRQNKDCSGIWNAARWWRIEEELAQGARAQGGKNLPQGQNRQCQDRKITDSKCR